MDPTPLHPWTMGVRRGKKRAFDPLEIGTKKQKFLEIVKPEI